jgi:hypothetical protein
MAGMIRVNLDALARGRLAAARGSAAPVRLRNCFLQDMKATQLCCILMPGVPRARARTGASAEKCRKGADN